MSSKPPRSNRRVHSKSIERRQRILDAAARALAEHGYSAAKLADIAQEAGTHAGSMDQRVLADWKIKIAIDLDLIPKPKKCSVCGTEEGRIDYHNEDYGRPLQTVAICQKCHLALHNRHRSPGWAANWEKRVKDYGDGTKWFEHI